MPIILAKSTLLRKGRPRELSAVGAKIVLDFRGMFPGNSLSSSLAKNFDAVF